MRVLLDGNVLISYLLPTKHRSTIRTLVDSLLRQDTVLLVPEELLDELVAKVTAKPYLAQRIPQPTLVALLDILRSIGERIPSLGLSFPSVVRDRKDDYLLAYAVTERADYLVTGDQDLLVLGEVEGVTILTPRDFAALLRSRSQGPGGPGAASGDP